MHIALFTATFQDKMNSSIFASLTRGARFKKSKNDSALGTKLKFSSILDCDAESTSIDISTENNSKIDDTTATPNLISTDEEINEFRNRLKIRVKGVDIPSPSPSFASMEISKGIKSVILENVEKSAWKEPTPIQMQVIPSMLKGRDVLATAPTGSGKTGAFAIPILSFVSGVLSSNKEQKSKGISALILAPTRELAEQIHREMTHLANGRRIQIRLLKKSDVANAIGRQKKNSFNSVDILITTPLRLLTVLRSDSIDLSSVRMVVLDEADKLFDLQGGPPEDFEDEEIEKQDSTQSEHDQNEDLDDANSEHPKKKPRRIRSSFLSQVDEILSKCTSSEETSNSKRSSKGNEGRNERVQRALFSATIGPLVRELADSFLKDPVFVTVGAENAGASTIDQRLVFVGGEDGKLLAIRQIIQEGLKPPVLLFVQSIDRAKQLFIELVYDGINVDVMHAERSQLQREEVIRRFRTGDIWVLICTDLMARGIDFKGVQMVINYDLPQSAVSYIHRIGRTGRAGRKGSAVTFFTERDIPLLRPIANVMKLSGCDVPPWMLAIKPMSTKEKRKLRRSVPLRRKIDTSANIPPVEEKTTVEEVKKKKGKGRGKRKRNSE